MDPVLTPSVKQKASTNTMPPDTPSPSQQDTTKVNAPPPLMEGHKDTLLQMQKKQIHSASISQNFCSVEKYFSTKLKLKPTSVVYSINIPQMPLKIFNASHP